jgi:hypothetical protein
LAPEALLVSHVSPVRLVSVAVITVLRLILPAALQPLATAALEAIATTMRRGEIATTASTSTAIMALPTAIPIAAATTPTGGAGALWFAPETE